MSSIVIEEERKEEQLKIGHLNDDDWLNTDFTDENFNMYPSPRDSYSLSSKNLELYDDDDQDDNENDEIAIEQMDDEGLLEATKIHQVGYHDSNGVDYGQLYTKENIENQLNDEGYKNLEMEIQYQFRQKGQQQNYEDFEDSLNGHLPMFTVMDDYHAFTIKRRVEQANQQWGTGLELTDEQNKREIKVTFSDIVDFFQIDCEDGEIALENEDDQLEPENVVIEGENSNCSSNTIEHLTSGPSLNENSTTLQPMLMPSDCYNSVKMENENETKKFTPSPIETDDKSLDSVNAPAKTRSRRKGKKVKSIQDSNTITTKCKKSSSQESNLTNILSLSLSKDPTQASKLRNFIKVSKMNSNGQKNSSNFRRIDYDMKIIENSGPFANPTDIIKAKNRVGKSTLSNRTIATSSKSSSKTNISLFPIPNDPPSMSPIFQSVLDPKNLSILAKSCNQNSNVLKELRTQILKHKIQKSTLENILNKKLINLIYADNIRDSNSIISIGCQTNNNNSNTYFQQTLSSKSKTKSFTKTHLNGTALMDQQDIKRRHLIGSQNYYCRVQETSKWASKPEFVLPLNNNHLMKNSNVSKGTTTKRQNTSPAVEKVGQNLNNLHVDKKRLSKQQILSMDVNNLRNSKMTTGKLPLMIKIVPSIPAPRKKITSIKNTLLRGVKT